MSSNSKDHPFVTVVTVTYNSSTYVRDAIESVLAQDYSNFEYIICDDCSTDNTWEIICEYKDPRIIAIRNSVNLGEYPNRNQAIALAKGKYLLFIDGDDVLLKHGLGFYVYSLEKFPECGMAIQKGYFNNIIFPVVLDSREVIINHYFGKTDLLSSSFASNFFRLDVLRKAGGLSTAYKGGDNHIRVKLASQYPVLFIAGWVSWPRETPGSASSKIDTTLTILEMYRYTEELMNHFDTLDKSLCANINNWMIVKKARLLIRRILMFDRKAIQVIRKEKHSYFSIFFKGIGKVEGFSDILSKHTSVNPLKQK